MTDYIVGCDNIVGGESDLIEKVCKVFEGKGHTAERLNVGPNYVQSSGLQGSSSGKVAVFIVGGSDIGTYVDFRDGLKNGYYHWKYAWFAFASWTAHSWITPEDLKNKPLVRAHDDNFSSDSSISPYIGKSADYFFQENKQYVNYVYGDTPEELAKKILAGGGDDTEDDSGSSATSIKEVIKELLSFWDTDVECRVKNDKVFINKILPPEEDYRFIIAEGLNIALDSINITDVNPDTVNFLTVHWSGGEDIVYRDEKLIERFGEKPLELDAVKMVLTEKSEDEKSSSDDSKKSSSSTDDGGDELSGDSSSSSSSTDESSDDGDSSSGGSSTSYEEVPVETLEEAENFAKLEWAKIKRDNGHSVELKVMGSEKWCVGAWSKVIIPRFDIDDYMYISRCSQSESNNEWGCNMTLVDYPPGFGEFKKEEEEETDDESAEAEIEEVEASVGDVNSGD